MNIDTVKTIAFEGRCVLSFFDQIDEVNASSDDFNMFKSFRREEANMWCSLPHVADCCFSVFLNSNCCRKILTGCHRFAKKKKVQLVKEERGVVLSIGNAKVRRGVK